MTEHTEPANLDYPLHLTHGMTTTLSSEGEDWDGIVIDEIDIQADGEAHLPALDYHLLSMTLAGTTNVVQKCAGATSKGVFNPGALFLVRSGYSSFWWYEQPHQTSVFRIPVNLVASAADQMGCPARRDDLVNAFGSRDVPTQQLCSVLLSELHQPRHPAQRLIVGWASHALAAQLLRHFAPDVQTVKTSLGLPARSLARVVEYMNDHLGESIGLSDLARLANVSRFHFARQFKLSTGISPIAYLERSRIRRAQALIRAGGLRLTEIAVAVGFADQSHFTRRFRRHIGYTPGEFQRQPALGLLAAL